MSPRLWGEGGYLDLLWFPVTQMCVRIRQSIHVCARLCLHDVSYSFSLMAFKFTDMVTMDKTLNRFCYYGSFFKVTGGHYVSKLTLFTGYFQQFFANGFQVLRYGDHGPDLERINFSLPKCVSGSICPSVPDFVYAIFPICFLPMVFKFSDIVIMDKILN